MERSRNFVFTDFDVSRVSFWTALSYRYLVLGKETCPTSGRKHLQGLIILKNAKTFSAMRRVVGTCHIEFARDVPKSIEYCKKEGDYEEHGEIPLTPGTRTDLSTIATRIRNHESIRTLLEDGTITSYQQGKFAEFCQKHFKTRSRATKPKAIWIYGKTGTGKTRSVYEQYPSEIIYNRAYRDNGTLWFTGYDPDTHKVVLFDDIRAHTIAFDLLLRILDYAPFDVRIHGGVVPLLADTIIFTCPQHPRDLFRGVREDVNQLIRRIDEIKNQDEIGYISDAPDDPETTPSELRTQSERSD